MSILYWTLLITEGFLCGGIMFSELVPKKILCKDIYEISVDNNSGAFNVFKHCGKKVGLICLFLDVLKGFIPVLLASLFMDVNNIAFAFVMVAPALGHAIGLFNRFHGGKCVATSFGIMLGLIPVTWIGLAALAGLYIIFSTVARINNGGVRSVVVYAVFAVVTGTALCVLNKVCAAIGCVTVAILPIIKFLFSKKGMAENRYGDIRR